MSTTVTLRPNALNSGGSGWTFGGGATTIYGALSDDADATYAMSPATNARVTFPALTAVPAGAQIRTVTLRLRVSGNSSTLFSAYLYRYGSTKSHAFTAGSKPGALATWTFSPLSTDVGGGPWTVGLVNSISIQIGAAGTAVHFVEMYLDVVYNEVPVVSAVGPTGSQTSQSPPITWNYSDPDGDVQERYQVRVFTDAVVTAAGFNPATSSAVRDSGEVYSADTTWAGIGAFQALAAGVYWAYVKAADAGSGGRYSAWASSSFTIVGDPPGAPALISATAEPSNGRVAITVGSKDNLLGNQQATADGASGEPLRWAAVTNSGAPTTSASGLAGNAMRFTATGAGAVTVRTVGTGVLGFPVPGGAAICWAGWIRSATVAGTAHVDLRLYDSTGTDLGTTGRVSNTITISTGHQACSGCATVPGTAGQVYYAALEWNVAGASAAQAFDTDYNSIGLGLNTSARGGLDSRNLFGPAESTFTGAGVGTWVRPTGYVGTVAQAADAAAYDGQHLEYQPGTVGAAHLLTLSAPRRLPVPGGAQLSAATYQFQFQGRANVANLKVGMYLYFYDDLGAQIGAAVFGGTITLANSAAFTKFGMTTLVPVGATQWNVQLVPTGETATTDRFIFDRFGMQRVPAGTVALQQWKPSPGVDTWPQVEYSDDSGATWTVVRNSNLSLFDPVTRLGTVYDYEMTPNTPRTYRAKTAGLDFTLDLAGAQLVSAASSVSGPVTLPVTDFWLVDPYTQTRIRAPIIGDIALSSNEPQGMFDALGRPLAVVQSDVTKGEQLGLSLAFNSAGEYDAFEAMRDAQHVLLLQTPAVRSWYLKLGGPRVATWKMGTMGEAAGGKWTVDLSAVQVDRPA